MTSSNDDIIKVILQYQERLERYSLSKSEDKMLYVLGKLSKLQIRTLHLETTGVGRTVNALKKLGGTVGEAAKDLVALWKVMVLEEERATQDTSLENEDDADSVYSSENENKDCQKENPHHSENESEGYDSKQEVPKKSNDFENKLHNLKNGDGSRNNHKSNSSSSSSSESEEEMTRKQKKHHSRKRSHSSHSSSEERETHSKKSKKDRDNSSKDSHRYKSSKENKNSKHEKSDKQSSNKYKENSEKHKESSVKYKKNSERSDLRHKSRKDSENESKQKSKKECDENKHKNKKDSENLRSSNKPEKNKNDEEKEFYDSHSNHKSEKQKKQNEKTDKDITSSHTSKNKDKSSSHSSFDKNSNKEQDKKHESKRDKKESHSETKSKDSTKEYKNTNSSKSKSSESSSSSKHKSSSSDIHVKKKHKSDKVSNTNKQKIVHGIDSESGASFAEALGMCGPLTSSPKKKPSSDKLKSSHNSSRHLDNVETEPSKSLKSKYNDSECSSTKLVVPELLKEEPVEPLNICLSSLLPEITPNYKPLGISYESQPKRLYTDDEALSRVMTNKNQRTKVYSGNKTVGKVESLFQLCVRILQDNIDALEYTGGVPYIILKPIMERATADQIFNLEHHNPYLIEDTDELWQLHCQKDFRTKQRQEMESWRDMYMRCLDEREAKLNAVKANIKLSQDKSLPVRTTKLAYVDSEFVKPPRNVARKQFKNGTVVTDRKISTSQKLSQLAQSGEASKVSVPDPGRKAADRSGGSSTVSSSSAMKPKKAPLMAKTLSFLKNRFKR